MGRYVAFLRGMNLGRRRITNDSLCAAFTDLGLRDVSAFLASGNVLFDAERQPTAPLARRIREGLSLALGYDVPTFLRTATEVAAIAKRAPFEPPVGADGGKLQVALLGRKPTESARRTALAFATDEDRLALPGRELYWLPRGKITESALDLRAVEAVLGPFTVRTRRTLERIAAQ